MTKLQIETSPIARNSGLDNNSSPPWLMVPLSGSKYIIVDASGIRRNNPGRNTALITEFVRRSIYGHSSNQDFARIHLEGVEGMRAKFRITGKIPGSFVLVWDANGYHESKLEVCVKSEKVVNTTFHFVKDINNRGTRRPRSDVAEMIEQANKILSPQANVRIVQKSVRETRISESVGRTIVYLNPEYASRDKNEWYIVTDHRDIEADYNVFFVGDYRDRNIDTDNTRVQVPEDSVCEDIVMSGGAGAVGATETHKINGKFMGDTLIIDRTRRDRNGVILAHEWGHAVGLGHACRLNSELMFPTATVGQFFIPKLTACAMNPSANRSGLNLPIDQPTEYPYQCRIG